MISVHNVGSASQALHYFSKKTITTLNMKVRKLRMVWARCADIRSIRQSRKGRFF